MRSNIDSSYNITNISQSFTTYLKRFIAYIDIERGLSKKTIYSYTCDLQDYTYWLQNNRNINNVNDISQLYIESYVRYLTESGLGSHTIARRISSIHEWHRFMLSNSYVQVDVSKSVKSPKLAEHLPDVLSIEEVNRVIDAASNFGSQDAISLRDCALLEFLYATGARISEAVGVCAIKYFDLSQNRTSPILFEWDKVLSFEGNTGPYLQYTYVRIKSILNKVDKIDKNAKVLVESSTEAERDLVSTILKLPTAVIKAYETKKPNVIADYVYDLAKKFNSFYNNEKILTASSEELRNSRILLSEKVGEALKKSLALLGIKTVDKM